MKPITKEKIGWGIIGTGWIASEFCEALRLTNDGYVAAVGSRTLEKAQAFTEVHGGKPYGSYEELMQDPDVDIVYVATLHMVHEENVVMAAKYGKNILCEKPFAINRPQAARMFKAAEDNGVFCMEGLWSRFFPIWQKAQDIIASGELGPVVSVDAYTCWGALRGNKGFKPNDRHVALDLAGGALLDAGIYTLAATSLAVGHLHKMPQELHSFMRFEEVGCDSDTEMFMKLDNDVTAHCVCSLHMRTHEATIYCENGSITIPEDRAPDTMIVKRRLTPSDFEVKEIKEISKEAIRADARSTSRPRRKMGWGHVTNEYNMSYFGSGFQFEAEVVHDCLRKGLTHCPEALPEETLTLIGICDEVRKAHGLRYPFPADDILFENK